MLRSRYAFLILLCLAVALFGLVYPVYVIRPFRHQGVSELQAALVILRYRGILEALASVVSVAAFIALWNENRGANRGIRAVAAAVATLAVLASAVLSRVNIYERMFHPIGKPSFASAGETRLDNDERIIAIKINGAARAYPVRSISFHHIVNDVAGRVPIVATY